MTYLTVISTPQVCRMWKTVLWIIAVPHHLLLMIWDMSCITILAKYWILMSRVVTLRGVFSHKAILAKLSMCENTTTKYRKLIFGTTFLSIILLVITYSVVAYLTVIVTPQVWRIWKTVLWAAVTLVYHYANQKLLAKVQTITIVINQIVHQAQDVQ